MAGMTYVAGMTLSSGNMGHKNLDGIMGIEFDIRWPQIAMLCIICLGTFIEILRHGKERTGKHSFPVHIIAIQLNLVITYFGGFWTK